MIYSKEFLIAYLTKHYPDTDNAVLSRKLGMSETAIRTFVSRNGIRKSEPYMQMLRKKMMEEKEKKYLASIPKVDLNTYERNIIIGSILGDGNLTFAQRSRNAYYREHFCAQQKEYREWKMRKITSLSFRIEKERNLKSPSHPVFTELYSLFYINRIKTITEVNIKLLDHPVGLACLYLDDGTLMISKTTKNNNIYITPAVGLTTLCFSKEECEILKEHLNKQFNTKFKIACHPDGKGNTLRINKVMDVYEFYELISPYCDEITCLNYKWDIHMRLESIRKELLRKNEGNIRVRIASTKDIPARYCVEQEKLIVKMIKQGKKYGEIAAALNRTYDGIVNKVRVMREKGIFD